MKLYIYIVIFMMISFTTSIGKYDFNACRISNCNAEQINCINQQTGCFNYFAVLKTCLSTCPTNQYFNSCWKTCKDNSALTNAKYLSLSLCYENVCYLYGGQFIILISLLVLILIL